MSEMMTLRVAIPLPEQMSALIRALGMQGADDRDDGNQNEAPSKPSSSTSDLIPRRHCNVRGPLPSPFVCIPLMPSPPCTQAAIIGSHFGQAVVKKKYDKGNLVDVAEAQLEFATEQHAVVVCACGKEFSWKPPWLIHAKFCNKVVEPELVQTKALAREAEENDDSDEETPPRQEVEKGWASERVWDAGGAELKTINFHVQISSCTGIRAP